MGQRSDPGSLRGFGRCRARSDPVPATVGYYSLERDARRTHGHFGRRTCADSGMLRIGSVATVYASDGSLTVVMSPLSISVKPMLTFLSGSKDGCWTLFVRPEDREGPEPRLRTSVSKGAHDCFLRYELQDQGPATLRVQADPQAGSITVEANTTVRRLVYSHLNSYCDFEVRGHRRLALEFSPCPGVPVEVRKFDYPAGRPARFAFVDKDGIFRVVEASSGEKGPFHTLAQGQLGQEETLTITLHDDGRPIGRVRLADWAWQADTTLSPTAGWGVPVNAIEFSLSDDAASSLASIFVTLAGTSVGRGWDCVGHSAGTYRNRISVETLKAVPSSGQPAATDRER